MDRTTLVNSKLLRMEATALFARIGQAAAGDRWWFFAEARRVHYPSRIDQSISAYRAWMRLDYSLSGVPIEIYLERDAETLRTSGWNYSIYVEGKGRETQVLDMLKPLSDAGYRISNGNENLERQMNFSLGLYGACLQHIVITPPSDGRIALEAAMAFMDALDAINRSLGCELVVPDTQDDDDYGFDSDVIFGDWQTWK